MSRMIYNVHIYPGYNVQRLYNVIYTRNKHLLFMGKFMKACVAPFFAQ